MQTSLGYIEKRADVGYMELTRRGYDAELVSGYSKTGFPEQKFTLGLISSTKALGAAENNNKTQAFTNHSKKTNAYYPQKSPGIDLIKEDLPSRVMRAYYAAITPNGYLTGEFLNLKG